MGEQEPPPPQQQEEQEQKDLTDGSGKRKLDAFELAKQRAQEIASRIASEADQKRPRLVSDNTSEPSVHSNSLSASAFFPIPFAAQPSLYHGSQGSSKKIAIPNGKVGVVIGKGGETIKNIQLQSGAKIQITKDQDADPHSLTRDVELMGTSEQISRAEELINDVIAETDAGGSASSAVHGLNTKQSGAEQFSMKVPNDKIGLLIGKGGETIKHMQSRSGTRMQIIPLHLPPGDPSTERTLYINGSTEQIEAAKELVNDVISGKRIINPSLSSSYPQPVYPPTGNWAQPGQPSVQQPPPYGYAQPGNQPAPSSYYGNYSQQPAWDQSTSSTLSQTPQQMTGYGYYGQPPQMGSAPLNPSYSYNQTPAASNTYEYSYSQQTPSYGQNVSSQAPTQEQQKTYAASSYGSAAVSSQPDGTSQSSQAAPAYPPSAYSQPMVNPQTYWTSSFAGQQPPQTGYDQTGYSQTAYGGLQPIQVPPSSTQPAYGQGGYPPQPTSATANYVQGAYPASYAQPLVETQPPSQPSNNDHSQSLAYGVENHDGNSNPSHGSNTAVQEAVPSQS